MTKIEKKWILMLPVVTLWLSGSRPILSVLRLSPAPPRIRATPKMNYQIVKDQKCQADRLRLAVIKSPRRLT